MNRVGISTVKARLWRTALWRDYDIRFITSSSLIVLHPVIYMMNLSTILVVARCAPDNYNFRALLLASVAICVQLNLYMQRHVVRQTKCISTVESLQ